MARMGHRELALQCKMQNAKCKRQAVRDCGVKVIPPFTPPFRAGVVCTLTFEFFILFTLAGSDR
jgi:hypothetical protein